MIRNNRVVGCSSAGITISASQKAIVENNTCYGNRWNVVLHGMPRAEYGGCKLAGNRVAGNIFGGAEIDVVLFSGKGASDNVVDGNFYAPLSASAWVPAQGPAAKPPAKGPAPSRPLVSLPDTWNVHVPRILYRDLASLRGQGLERTGQQGDPGWVNPEAGDFRLRPGSPAEGKGWQEAAAAK